MECEAVRQVVEEYVRHQLPDHLVSDIEAHLCICEQCRIYLSRALDKKEEGPASLPKPIDEKSSPAGSDGSLFAYTVIAAAVAVVIFIIVLFFRTQDLVVR